MTTQNVSTSSTDKKEKKPGFLKRAAAKAKEVVARSMSRLHTVYVCVNPNCDFQTTDKKKESCPTCGGALEKKNTERVSIKSRFVAGIVSLLSKIGYFLTKDPRILTGNGDQEGATKKFLNFFYLHAQLFKYFIRFIGIMIACSFWWFIISSILFASASLFGADIYRDHLMPVLVSIRDSTSKTIASIPLDPESHLLAESERAREESEAERKRLQTENDRLQQEEEQARRDAQLANENFYSGIENRNLHLFFAFNQVYSEHMYVQLERDSTLFTAVIGGYPELSWIADHFVIKIRKGEGRDNFDIVLIPSKEELYNTGRQNAMFGVLTKPTHGTMEITLDRRPYNEFGRLYPGVALPPEQR